MTLKRCSRFLSVMGAAVLSIVFIPPVSAAPTCNFLADSSTYRLVPAHPTAIEEQIASREEMDRIAARIGVPAAVREAHPLMLITAQAGVHVEVANRVLEGHDAAGEAYFCEAPNSVMVLLGAFKSKIILYRKAAADPCVRQALLDHQLQHSRVLDEKINLFVNEHRDNLADAIRVLTRKPAPDATSATRTFETGLSSLIAGLYRQFEVEVARSRLDADTPSALDQLRNACEGRLRRLELELGGPNARRASLQALSS